MKIMWTILLAVVLLAGLVLGGSGASAAEEETELCRGIFGTVAGVSIDDEGAGTIDLEGALPVQVEAATRYHVPTIVPPWQTWAGLSDDARILVQGSVRVSILLTEDTSQRMAMKVMIVPQYPVRSHHVGVVISIDGDTITILQHNEKEVTIFLPEGMDMAPGDVVTIIGQRLAGEPRPRAVAVHNIKQLAHRFQSHLNDAQGEAAFEHVSALLDRAHNRHMEMLDRLKARAEIQANDRAVEALGKAIQNAQRAYDNLVQRRTEIRDRIRDSWDELRGRWAEIAGTITELNIEYGNVVVAVEGDEVTLGVSGATRVLVGTSLSELDGLAPGDFISRAVYDAETMEAALIIVRAPAMTAEWQVITGVVREVNLEEQTVTIIRAVGDPVTITITGETRTAMGGRIITLGQVKDGYWVKQAVYATDTMEAQSLLVTAPPPRGRS